VAATLSTLVGFIGLLIVLAIRRDPLALNGAMLRSMRIDWPIFKAVIKIGLPTGLQVVMVSFAEIAVLSFVNRFGSTATAAYGAVNQIVSYVQFPAISIGIASSIFGAQSIGARRFDRLRGIVRSGIALNYIIGGALILVVYAFSWNLLEAFIKDENVVKIAHDLLTITLWSYVIFGNSAVLSGVMRSSGTVLWPTSISVFSVLAIEVPVAYVLSQHTSLGLRGIWIAYPVAFAVGLALQTTYYKLVWRKMEMHAITF
jgi:putative MATE family efflux protein